ncbi:hypothetical protein ACMHYO_00805 [Allopusillimonas ginsengisoli]|uniref:hypothetical protein n=1 Tax=Allopusillimonas ginsengisoli TaxID=453575 RepID=UPI0010C16A1F|nr:hypothetical protein D7I39_09275 [Allopusillimonas ginsengisoli]
MQALFRAALVPGLILLLTGLYWLHIADAPSAAQRVPLAVITVIVVMAIIVLLGDLLAATKTKTAAHPAIQIRVWIRQWKTQIIFMVLSFGYFAAFITLGFNLANFLFLIIALPVAGVGQGMGRTAAIVKVGLSAFVMAGVFYILAQLMDFNAPAGPLGF